LLDTDINLKKVKVRLSGRILFCYWPQVWCIYGNLA